MNLVNYSLTYGKKGGIIMNDVANRVNPMKYWVQSILPQSYSDSLSYQELLYKVITHLNQVIDLANLTKEEVDELYNFIHNSGLNDIINQTLEEWYTSGKLGEIINDILLQGINNQVADDEIYAREATGYGVITGLEVNAQESPDLSVMVKAGVAHTYAGKRYIQGQDQRISISPAHGTYARWDIVYVSANGQLMYLTGVPSATPTKPIVEAGAVILAYIFVNSIVTYILEPNIEEVDSKKWSVPELVELVAGVVDDNRTKASQASVDALVVTMGTKASQTSVTDLGVVVASKASQTTVDGLADAIEDLTLNKADNSSVTALSETVATKASQIALDALNQTVGTKANQTNVEALAVEVSTKASQSSVDDLAVVVGTKASQTTVDTLAITVGSKANQADVEAIEQQLENIGSLLADGDVYNLLDYMSGGITAIQAMRNILTEIHASSASRFGIKIPSGVYDFKNMTEPFVILKGEVYIYGDGKNTVLEVYDGKLFQWGNATTRAIGGGLSNVNVIAPVTPTNNQIVVYCHKASNLAFSVWFTNINQFIVLTPTAGDTDYCSAMYLNLIGGKVNSPNALITVNRCAGVWITGNTFAMNVPNQAHGVAMTAVAGCNFLSINGMCDTVSVLGLHERYYVGINASAGAGVVQQNIIINALFDYCTLSGVLFSTNGAGAVVSNVNIVEGSYMCSWGYHAIQFYNTLGTMMDITISGVKIPIAGTAGVSCGNVDRLSIRDCVMGGLNQAGAGNAVAGIYLSGTNKHVSITNNTLYDATPYGQPWGTQPYIAVSAETDFLVVKDNDCYGVIVYDSSTPTKNRLCIDNRISGDTAEMNYFLNKGAWAVPANSVAYTHLSAKEIVVTLYGGTGTNVTYNGVSLWNGSGAFPLMRITLRSGDTLSLSYAVAPVANYNTTK